MYRMKLMCRGHNFALFIHHVVQDKMTSDSLFIASIFKLKIIQVPLSSIGLT